MQVTAWRRLAEVGDVLVALGCGYRTAALCLEVWPIAVLQVKAVPRLRVCALRNQQPTQLQGY